MFKQIFRIVLPIVFLTLAGLIQAPAQTYDERIDIQSEGLYHPEYRNCPIIITYKEHPAYREHPASLSLRTNINLNFDPEERDECEGNLRELWKDFEILKPLMGKYEGNISMKLNVGLFIREFPVSQIEISRHLDMDVKARPSKYSITNYDFKKLEDVLQLQKIYNQLAVQKLPEYVQSIHAPIINSYLKEYDLVMSDYDVGEKMRVCIRRGDSCAGSSQQEDQCLQAHPELDVIFKSTWDYHWESISLDQISD